MILITPQLEASHLPMKIEQAGQPTNNCQPKDFEEFHLWVEPDSIVYIVSSDLVGGINSNMDRPPTLDVSERISISVSQFKGILYFHIRDKLKQKSISLKRDDFAQLFKMREQLLQLGKKVEEQHSHRAKMSEKKNERRHRRKSHWERGCDTSVGSSDSDAS